jgi:branched-chain amino acid transport system substrate-binding protein
MFHPTQKIGVYTLVKRLGRGGFGEVWLAERHGKFATTKVAVKLPLDELVDHALIEHEAQLWAKASGHPNVLPIIEADEYDGQIVIVSEYAPDGSLEEWLKMHGKMPVEKAVQTTIQILDGLEFLHSRNIIHRDLKPANILLQGTTPRLADFGISRVVKTSVHATTAAGTPYYMAPEAFKRGRTIQTDIWSVGVMLYQMLTGELPFLGNDIYEIFVAVKEDDPEPLPNEVPIVLKKVVMKSLAKAPAERYQTAGKMRKDLDDVLAHLRNPTFTPIETPDQLSLRDTITEEINNDLSTEKPLANQLTGTKPAHQAQTDATENKEELLKSEEKKQNFKAATARFTNTREGIFVNSASAIEKRNAVFLLAAILIVIFASYFLIQPYNTKVIPDNNTIKVGVYGDLTGPTSSFGLSTKNGIQLAVDEINAAGGVNGKKIVLVVEDDQGRPVQAKTVISKLINQDKVQAVLGTVASSVSLAAAPVAQEAKIPMITPSSTNPKVTEVGDYISRICFIDPLQGKFMAKFAANTLKAKTAAIIGDVQSDYSKGLAEFFRQEFTRRNGKIVAEQKYAQTDWDFRAQLTAIRNSNPDVIYIPGYYGQVAIIAKQARELGMNMPLLGGDGWDSPELWTLGGNALNNSYITNHFAVDNPAPEVQNFVKAYQAKFGVVPDSLAALAYDAAKVLADAIKRAGGTDSVKLKNAINMTEDFDGVTGNIRLDSNRNAVKPAVIQKLNPITRKFDFKEMILP